MKYISTFRIVWVLSVALIALSACVEEVQDPSELAITFLVSGEAPAASTPISKIANVSHISLSEELHR